jgi:hypothetical protein
MRRSIVAAALSAAICLMLAMPASAAQRVVLAEEFTQSG